MKKIYKILTPKRIYPLVIVTVCCIAVGALSVLKLFLNLTPSMKEGFYITKGGKFYERGAIVSVCLKEPYLTVGLTRSYVPNGWRCNHAMPLIKQIIAVPGDNVILSTNFISVNGVTYPYQTYHYDSLGRPLTVYPRGKYPNTTGYWLIGANDSKSWDSRYWGPVDRNQILTKLKPLLTW